MLVEKSEICQWGTQSLWHYICMKLLERRSVRKFKSDMVPKEVLNCIIEVGTYLEVSEDWVVSSDCQDRKSYQLEFF